MTMNRISEAGLGGPRSSLFDALTAPQIETSRVKIYGLCLSYRKVRRVAIQSSVEMTT